MTLSTHKTYYNNNKFTYFYNKIIYIYNNFKQDLIKRFKKSNYFSNT